MMGASKATASPVMAMLQRNVELMGIRKLDGLSDLHHDLFDLGHVPLSIHRLGHQGRGMA